MVLMAFLSTLAIAAAYASAFLSGGVPPWGLGLMVGGVAGLVVSSMALGALRRSTRGRSLVIASLAFTFVALVAGFALALTLPPDESATGRLVLGLPVRAASIFYIVGALPLVILPIVYVVTFDSATLTAADLARVRAARQARDGEAANRTT
jgi:hypothetical protein